jgi:3-hydroxy acid dehydrogenase/malonic semialdehyde reductase
MHSLRNNSTKFLRTLIALGTPIPAFNPIHQTLRSMASSAMSKRLEGKTIVVTGASSGIGRSTAIEFARTRPKNLRLILTARRIDALKEIAAEIKKEVGDGVKVLPFKLDVSKPEEVRGFVGNLPEEWREIDVLVNNAWVCSGRESRRGLLLTIW